MIALLLMAFQAVGTVAPDQTGDFVTVARFLEAVRSGDRRAGDMVAGVPITDPFRTEKRTLGELRDVTRTCRLQQLSVSEYSVSQVAVQWACPNPRPKIYGDIWVKAGRIERVSFGKDPRIMMTPINRR
jgi:hypothetical protein